jgi:hypothetical protein
MRWLRSGKQKKQYAFYVSSKLKEEADSIADNLRAIGKNAVVRKGGTKWDVFARED